MSTESESESADHYQAPPRRPLLVRQVLPLSATIPPGEIARAIARPQVAFRAERLLISPHSFPPSLARRAWAWPLVAIGHVLGRLHRGIARLLRVDLRAPRERREYVSAEYARTHAQEVSWEHASWDQSSEEHASWDQSGEGEDDDDLARPFVWVQVPPGVRGRLIAPLGRASTALSRILLDWQEAQLSTLRVCGIAIHGSPQLAGSMPGDAFSPRAIGLDLGVPTCANGGQIEVEIHNTNRRACRLVASVIGSTI